MTPQEAIERIKLLPGAVAQAVEAEQPLAILDLEADIKHNVFTEGMDAEGEKIGTYSKRPMYVSILGSRNRYGSQLPLAGMAGAGKYSNLAKFKNGKLRKSRYFAYGYSGFRAFVGRENEYVNLDLTGDLFNSIVSGTSGNVSIIAFLAPGKADLAGYLEDKYGKTIFAATDDMEKAIVERLEGVARVAAAKVVGEQALKEILQ